MPLIPATLPENSNKITAEHPSKAPPARDDQGVKFSIIGLSSCLYSTLIGYSSETNVGQKACCIALSKILTLSSAKE